MYTHTDTYTYTHTHINSLKHALNRSLPVSPEVPFLPNPHTWHQLGSKSLPDYRSLDAKFLKSNYENDFFTLYLDKFKELS